MHTTNKSRTAPVTLSVGDVVYEPEGVNVRDDDTVINIDADGVTVLVALTVAVSEDEAVLVAVRDAELVVLVVVDAVRYTTARV